MSTKIVKNSASSLQRTAKMLDPLSGASYDDGQIEVNWMMQFSLLTPEGELYNAQVEEVHAQGSEGNLGILPDHISLVTALKVAPLGVKVKGQVKRFAVYGGILHVTPEKVTAFADHAELPERIDRAKTSARKDELQSQLQRASDPHQRENLKRQMDIAQVQLEVLS